MKTLTLKNKIQDIIRLKKLDLTWKSIATSVNSNVESVKTAYKRYKKIVDLPPKEKRDRSKLSDRLGGILKRNLRSDSSATL